jgi:glycosyltransferase involved in cell wall biosynthesis
MPTTAPAAHTQADARAGLSDAPFHVWVELSHHLDAHAWPERHAAGEVPNITPFGLDALTKHGFDVAFRPGLKGRIPTRVARVVHNRFEHVEWVESVAALRSDDYRRADVVLCWTEFKGIPAGFRRALAGGPPVVMGAAHLTDPAGYTRRFLWTARHALERMHTIFVHSESMIPVLRGLWGLESVRLETVPFGVDPQFFVPTAQAVRRDVVASVGDDSCRDHETLIRAVARVRERHPSVRLQLATNLPVDLPPDVGLPIREHLGPRRPEFYGRAAVVAVATRPNVHGSGLSVVLEAMACGRPYVVTAAAGLTGYVRDQEDGLVVPPGDAEAMAQAVQELIADPDRADALGRAGRERLERELTTDVQAGELARVLRDAVER